MCLAGVLLYRTIDGKIYEKFTNHVKYFPRATRSLEGNDSHMSGFNQKKAINHIIHLRNTASKNCN